MVASSARGPGVMRSRLLGARGRANFTSRVKRRRPAGLGVRVGGLCLDILGEGWFGLAVWGRVVSFVVGGGVIGVYVGDGVVSGVFVPLVGLLAPVGMLRMLARFLFG